MFNNQKILKKSRQIFFQVYKQYKRRKKRLTPEEHKELHQAFHTLQEDILAKNPDAAKEKAHYLNFLSKEFLKKTKWEFIRDFFVMIIVALLIAVLVRTMWFEFYEIPTGSMRSTLQEKDRLLVSKTVFGINIPLRPGHFYFDPNLVRRCGIFIFTGANMDIANVNTLYFYLFPGKKQYVKRLMGKPGDTLYFYGGKIYGIDQTGQDITPLLNPQILQAIDHVPYISFEGKTKVIKTQSPRFYSQILLQQMNEPVAKLEISPAGKVEGTLLPPFKKAQHYYNLWGMKNYGMARLLNQEQMKDFASEQLNKLPQAPLYLEILHHPDLNTAKLGQDLSGSIRPMIGITKSYLPLQQENVQKIFQGMYTARFVISSEKAYRYGLPSQYRFVAIPFPHVPDGTYEFRDGIAYEVKWQGILKKLPDHHPLNQFSTYRTQLLYNIGIEFDARFLPRERDQNLLPNRYVYFRNGDMYSMGKKIADQNASNVQEFVREERAKGPTGFYDDGPPIKADGKINREFLEQFGLKIPKNSYLALGDNYAMSGDSREFGFVPQDNIRGAPSCILWPPGDRFGAPLQPTYALWNLPRTIIWTLAGLTILLLYVLKRKKESLPLAEFQTPLKKD